MVFVASADAPRSRGDAPSIVAVEAPSAYVGVAKALSAAYRLPKLPDDLARLLARLR